MRTPSERSFWGWSAVILALRVASPATTGVAFAAAAVLALGGPAQAVHALSLSWLMLMLNSSLARPSGAATVGRYAVLLAAAISVFLWLARPRRVRPTDPMLFATLGLGVVILVHSAVLSVVPDVSVLKAVTWTMAAATLVGAWSLLDADQRDVLARRLFIGLNLVALASIPMLALRIGYSWRSPGFQGVLGHPQALGATMALLAAIQVGVLAKQRVPSWSGIGMLLLSLAFIVRSEARTAAMAFALGVAFAAFLSWVSRARGRRESFPGLTSPRLVVATLAATLAGAVALQSVTEQAGAFVGKRGGSRNLVGAYQDSRWAMIEVMLENVVVTPFTGIGFGIASDPQSMEVERDPMLNLPIGAQVEKGVMPVAVLEELGVPVFVLVMIWLGGLVARGISGGIVPAAAILTALFVNLGDAYFFSPGGAGLLQLIAAGWVVAAGRETVTTPAQAERPASG